MEKNKSKGQVGDLQGIVAVLIVVTVLLSAGFFILQTFSEEDQFFVALTATNETQGFANTTGYTVTGEKGIQTQNFVLTAVWGDGNQTNGTQSGIQNTPTGYITLVPLANVSMDTVLGVVVNSTNTDFQYPNLSLSYSYNQGDEGWVGINDTLGALKTIPDLLGLIILITVIGIVLAVVFNVIPGARVSGA